MPTNDNGPAMREAAALYLADVHGEAALLLVESLIHGLCENSTLSDDQAIEITERAVDVQFERAEEADSEAAPRWRSHALLSAILASLRIDSGASRRPRLV